MATKKRPPVLSQMGERPESRASSVNSEDGSSPHVPRAVSVAGGNGAVPAHEVLELPKAQLRAVVPLPEPKCKRDRVAAEFYTSELSYVNGLTTLVEEFYNPIRQPGTKVTGIMKDEDLRVCFSTLDLVRACNLRFLDDLEARLRDWNPRASVADLLMKHMPAFQIYAEFCSRFELARRTILENKRKVKRVAEAMLQFVQNNNGADVASYLILPVQRIPRYILLMTDMLTDTKPGHADHAPLTAARAKMQELADQVNRSIGSADDMKSSQTEGLEVYRLPTRQFVWEGQLSIHNPRKKQWGILFSDIFVVGVKDDNMFQEQMHLDLEMCWVADLGDTDPQSPANDAIEVYNLSTSFFIYVGSESAKNVWLQAMQKTIQDLVRRQSSDKASDIENAAFAAPTTTTTTTTTATSSTPTAAASTPSASAAVDVTTRVGSHYYADGSVYEGEVRDGQRHGQGVHITANRTQYEGQWVDDVRCGRGLITYPTAGYYDGEWRDDKPHGTGRAMSSNKDEYAGRWRDGRKFGRGVMTYANGAKYDGEWVNDRACGQGKFTRADGSTYEGSWLDSKMHGMGTLKHAWGGFYKGLWDANQRHGRGEEKEADGSVYEGEFHRNKRQGHGTLTRDGNVYVGEWADNKMEGKGKMTYADGSVYEGDFFKDLRSGVGTWSAKNGARYEGGWMLDRRTGTGVYTYPNSAVYEGSFENDMRSGTGTWNTPWGERYVGDWSVDVFHGRGLHTLPDKTTYEGDFSQGMRHGQGVYKCSTYEYLGTWRADRKHGEGSMNDKRVGASITGSFADNEAHGRGSMQYGTGTRWEGSWTRGQKDSAGELVSFMRGGESRVPASYQRGVLADRDREQVEPDPPLISIESI